MIKICGVIVAILLLAFSGVKAFIDTLADESE